MGQLFNSRPLKIFCQKNKDLTFNNITHSAESHNTITKQRVCREEIKKQNGKIIYRIASTSLSIPLEIFVLIWKRITVRFASSNACRSPSAWANARTPKLMDEASLPA